MAATKPVFIDWDIPEYQKALKVVIKYEIQMLLERLSQTGEETVLLTANTTDLCVGHLASEKGKRFLSTNEVGEMKNKFLYFCTVEGADNSVSETGIQVTVFPQKSPTQPGRGRGRGRPRGSATATGRGRKGVAQIQGVISPPGLVAAGQGQGDVSHRLAIPQHSQDYGALSDTEMVTKFSNSTAFPNVKPGEKRQQSYTAEEIQDMIVSAESKRRKIDNEKQIHAPVKQTQMLKPTDKNKLTTQKVENLPQSKHPVLLSDDDSNDYYSIQGHQEPRVSHADSTPGAKGPQFTQENSEFQKFLQQYNEEVNKQLAGEDSDYEDEYDEDEMEEYELMGNKLEKGELPQQGHFNNRALSAPSQIHPQTSQPHFTPSQFQSQFQNFQKNNQVFQTPQSGKAQTHQGTDEFDPNLEIKEEVETAEYGDNIQTSSVHSSSAKVEKDTKGGDNQPISLQSIINKATQKLTDQNVKKTPGPGDESVPQIKEEADPHDQDYKQSADSSTAGVKQQADSSNQRVESSAQQSDVQQPDTTQQNRGRQAKSPRPVVSGEKPKPNDYSDADVSAKLEMLSAKMSWVVEYPKNFNPQQQQQQQPSNFPHGAEEEEEEEEEGEYNEEYDGNEEQYNEEEELDESELERLAAMKQYRASQGMMGNAPLRGPHHGQGQDQFEDYDDEDFDEEEMERLGEEDDDDDYDDDEYGELDSEDERALREMGALGDQRAQMLLGRMQHGNIKFPPQGDTGQHFLNKGQVSQENYNQCIDGGNNAFAKTSSEMDNFMLMGAMAKCLVCNKLIRKNDIVQHNMIHLQEEDEEDEEEFDEMHEGVGEMHRDMGEMHEHLDEMGEEEEDMQELTDDLQEMHGNETEPVGEEMGEDIHGEMPQLEEAGEQAELDDEGGEIHDPGLTAEKMTAEELPPNTCEICMKTFKDKYRLLKHVKIHDPKDIKCDYCEKTFRLHSYLIKHQKKMHPRAVIQQVKETDEGKQNLPVQQEIEQPMTIHT